MAALTCRVELTTPPTSPAPLGSDPLDDDADHGGDRQPHAEADQQQPRRQQQPGRNRTGIRRRHGQRRRREPACRQDEAQRRRRGPEPTTHQGARRRADQEAGRERQDRQTGLQGREPERRLEIDRIGQEERGQRVEREDGAEAAHQARRLEHVDRDQRVPARLGQPHLVAAEQFDEHRCRGQHDDGPPGPAALAAFDQRHHQGREHQGREHDAADVQALADPAAGFAQQRDGGHEGQQRDRQVDEEDQPPAHAADVGPDQRAAEQLPDDRGQAQGDAVDAERPAPLMGREQRVHRGEGLGRHGGRGQRLEQPGQDQRHRRPGQPAERRGEREAHEPDQEHRLAAEEVAEPPARDEEHGIDHRVARDHQLDVGRRGPEPRRDRRHGDVDDEEVQRGQEGAGQQHRQRGPAVRIEIGALDRADDGGCVHGKALICFRTERFRMRSDQDRMRRVWSTISVVSRSLGPVLPSTRSPWMVHRSWRAIARSS